MTARYDEGAEREMLNQRVRGAVAHAKELKGELELKMADLKKVIRRAEQLQAEARKISMGGLAGGGRGSLRKHRHIARRYWPG